MIAAAVALILLLPALIPALNPFKEETVDRSGPVLLKSLENLSEYRASSANLQVVVDVEKDTNLVPSFIKGERTLFVAAGNVDAAVDFGGLGKSPDAVRVSGDRKEVAGDSPRVAGNRWTYFLTPWGLLMEIVDRSRVADSPPLVGPADWHAAAENNNTRKER